MRLLRAFSGKRAHDQVVSARYATAVVFHLPWCKKCAEKHRAFCAAAKLAYDPVPAGSIATAQRSAGLAE